MRFPRSILFLSAITLAGAIAQSPARADGPWLTGGDKALWLVRPAEGGRSFDVLVRPAGATWKVTARGLGGQVAGAAAIDDTLQVIFREPLGHGQFFKDSGDMTLLPAPVPPVWPAQTPPVALLAADHLAGIDRPSLVAIVPENASLPPAGAASSSSPAAARGAQTGPVLQTLPSGASPSIATSRPGRGAWDAPLTRRVRLVVLQSVDGSWRRIGRSPALDLGDAQRVLGAVAGGRLYLTICGPLPQVGATQPAAAPCRLMTAELAAPGASPGPASEPRDRWSELAPPSGLDSAWPLTMLTVSGHLTIVAAMPPAADGKSRLQLFLQDEGPNFSEIPLKFNQEPAAFAAASLPAAARLIEQVELVWTQGGKTMESRCGLNGQLSAPVEIPPAGGAEEEGRFRQINNYFVMAVMLLIALLVFVLRPVTSLTPFVLPPQMAPGRLGKRALAAVIDLTPWMMVSIAAFQIPTPTTEDLQRLLAPTGEPAADLAFAQMLGLGLFVLYCTVAETVFGTTVGKLILHLRVVGDQGQRPDLRSVALRNLMKVVEMMWLMLPVLILFPLLSRNRQRIGDMMARTAVVDTRPRPVPPTPPSQDQPPRDS